MVSEAYDVNAELDGQSDSILTKALFLAFSAAFALVGTVEWTLSGFGILGKAASHITKRIRRQMSRKPGINMAEETIHTISIRYSLDAKQRTMLLELLRQPGKKEFADRLERTDSLSEACKVWLRERDFGDEELINDVLADTIKEISSIVSSHMTPQQLYRLAILIKEDTAASRALIEDTRNLVERWNDSMVKLAEIPAAGPGLFAPLGKVLGSDIAVEAYREHMTGQRRDFPQGQMFRRPHVNWVDIDDRCVYVRQDAIDEIESNFGNYNLQLLAGESGSGKTTLSFVFGYKRLIRPPEFRSAVYYVDLNDISFGNSLDEATRLLDEISNISKAITEISSIDTSSYAYCTFIIDNIHLNRILAKRIYTSYRAKKSSIEKGPFVDMDFLLVARPLGSDLDGFVSDLMLDIVGYETDDAEHENWLSSLVLKKEQLDDVIAGITRVSLKKAGLEGQTMSEERISDALEAKTQGNLWVLSFVLGAIQQTAAEMGYLDPRWIEEVDVCSQVKEYYLDNLFEDLAVSPAYKEAALYLSGRSDEVQAFTSIWLALSTFNQIDIPVPEEFLHEAVAKIPLPIEPLKRFVNTMKTLLLDRGEIIAFEESGRLEERLRDHHRYLFMPHAVLAREVAQCFEKLGFRSFLSDSGEEMVTLDSRCGYLARFCLEKGLPINRLIESAFPSLPDGIVPTNTVRVLLSRPEVLQDTICQNPSLVGHFVEVAYSLSPDETLTLLEEVIRSSCDIKEAVERIGRLDYVLRSQRIQDAVAEVVRSSPKPWELAEALGDSPILRDCKPVQDAFAGRIPDFVEAIDRSEDPWRILGNIKLIPSLISNSDVESAIRRNLNRIEHSLQDSDTFTEVVEAISDCSLLENEPSIHQAIAKGIESIDDSWWTIGRIIDHSEFTATNTVRDAIASAIRKSDSPWKLIDRMKGIGRLVTYPPIQVAMESRTRAIADRIKKSEKPWEELESIAGLLRILKGGELVDAIEQRAEDIVAEIARADYCWWHETLLKAQVLRSNESVLLAIENAIRSDPEPWLLLERLGSVSGLLEIERIRDAIGERIDDLSAVVKTQSDLTQLLSGVFSIPVVGADPRVHESLATVIRNSSNPAEILDDILWYTSLCTEPVIIDAIAESILSTDDLSRMIEVISSFASISENPEIVKAIASAIAKTKDLPRLLKVFADGFLSSLLEDEAVSSALRRRFEDESIRIDSLEIPLETLSFLKSRLSFLEERASQDVFMGKAQEVAGKIEGSSRPWDIISEISSVDEIIAHPHVTKAIASTLQSSSQPELILNALGWSTKAMESDEIATAISEIILRSEQPWTILGNLPSFPPEVIIASIAEQIASPTASHLLFWALSEKLSFSENKHILKAVESNPDGLVKAISLHPDPFLLIKMSSMSSALMANDAILSAIITSIKNHHEPWDLVGSIASIPVLLSNPQIDSAIRSRIEYIANSLRESDTPSFIMSSIFDVQPLVDSSEIQRAIAEIIETRDDLEDITTGIEDAPSLYENEYIKAAFESRVDEVIAGISSSDEPWYIIEWASKVPVYIENPKVKAAILLRIDDIVEAASVGDDASKVLGSIVGVSEVLSHPRILQAVASQIEKKGLLGRDLSELMEYSELRSSPVIHKALANVLLKEENPDSLIYEMRWDKSVITSDPVRDSVLQLLAKSDDPWSIIKNVKGVPEFMSHPQTQDALKKLQTRISEGLGDMSKALNLLAAISGVDILTSSKEFKDLVSAHIADFTQELLQFTLFRLWVISDIWELFDFAEGVETIVRLLGEYQYPCTLISLIYEIPTLASNPSVRDATKQRLESIAKYIRSAEDPIRPIAELSTVSHIIEDEQIRAAIVDRISDLANKMKSADSLIETVKRISDVQILTMHPQIRRVLELNSTRIAVEIRHSREPQDLIHAVSQLPYLRSNSDIQAAIAAAAPAISQVLNETYSPCQVIMKIRSFPEILSHPSINHAVNTNRFTRLSMEYMIENPNTRIEYYATLKHLFSEEKRAIYEKAFDIGGTVS